MVSWNLYLGMAWILQCNEDMVIMILSYLKWYLDWKFDSCISKHTEPK